MIEKLLGNRYEILEEIGYGGMAKVYKAKCRLLNRFVAVKVLRDDLKNDSEFVRRFNIESQAAASLSHTNIVPIYDVGEENGIHYIVMEYIIGITLKEYIEQQGALEWYEAVDFAAQICRALEVAHKNFIVHRDIKPHNIIVTQDKILKVTDFGIARANNEATMTMDGNTIGSVQYISPEQARGGYTDDKTDIYSLGVVLYEMTTGRVPFGGNDSNETAVAIALKHIQDTPASPRELNLAIPKSVEGIIQKAMAKEQSNRYLSASQMLADIERVKRNPEVRIVGVTPAEGAIDNSQTVKMDSVNEAARVPLRKQQPQAEEKTPNIQTKPKKSAQESLDKFFGVDKESKKPRRGALKVTNKKRAITAMLILSVLIVGLIVGAVVLSGIFSSSADVLPPNLVGINIDDLIYNEATSLFTIDSRDRNDARFVIQVESGANAQLNADHSMVINAIGEDAEPGTIFHQNLSPDRTRRYNGTPIRIVVRIVGEPDEEEEDEEIVLPNFAGERRDYTDVRRELQQLGLMVTIEREYSDTTPPIPIGVVINTNPTGGTRLETGDNVTLIVSRGPVTPPEDDPPPPPPARRYEGFMEFSAPRGTEPTTVTIRLASTGQILSEQLRQPGENFPVRLEMGIPNPVIEVLHNGILVTSTTATLLPVQP